MKKLAAALSASVLMLSLAACGEEGADHQPMAEQTASNGDVFNDADVDFATQMVQHHAQALVMVDLTLGRELSPTVQDLAEDIREAQGPEIEQMVDWLTTWRKPIPETMRDHANADDHGKGGHDTDDDMPGMMSADEMAELEAAQGPEFEEMWLELMIEHHEGAVEMALDEQEHGVFAPAQELAESIESSQSDEIEHMQDLLDS